MGQSINERVAAGANIISDYHLPDGWIYESGRRSSDPVIDRQYQAIRLERTDGGAEVRITEEPKSFQGWGYQVVVDRPSASGTEEERVGIFQTMDAARDAASVDLEGTAWTHFDGSVITLSPVRR